MNDEKAGERAPVTGTVTGPRPVDAQGRPIERRKRSDDGSGGGHRDLMRRLRQPIIGLSMVGAATPLAKVMTQHDAPVDDQKSAGVAPIDPQTHAASGTGTPGTDLEEKIAGRIAEARTDTERASIVTAAVAQYDIAQDLAEDIFDIAKEQGIEPKLAYGLVKTESSFKTRATSHVGARGLTQVMPRTAKWLVPGTTAEDLYDRQTNLRLGFRYLDQLIEKYRGDVKLALLAYNRGPGTVDKVLKRGGNPDNGYATKVLRG